ncbi:6-phosphogluconolactonase [Microbacterium sp. SORGH_AS_0888]|uniref:6-phosphogluconolactonase n=1 Tax=Microbacterium sp. SORGH_AS_0888 TaxID=3041791 RepID=UPI0027877113|nr:6-phosphogluconolactonase [Microbacterium sp. SORGH_AS_0888]MDQ1128410.1 6-phosphogluconolactonase [Microbacterium sp. SORGH_AS_0888]
MAGVTAEKRVVILPDAEQLADAVAARFLSRLVKITGTGALAHISLTGGSMGGRVLEAAAAHSRSSEVDWSLVHLWWSDERFVPRGDADRNDGQAFTALTGVGIPAENVHTMAGSDDGLTLEDAARAYTAELARFADDEVGGWPSFDICFLGVGPDAHIASLFPDRPEIRVTDASVLPVRDSPKPPPERLTLTRPVINSSQRVWLVLSGADKASALGLALAGASYQSVPAAGAKGRSRTVFFVDEAAAAKVPPELIDAEY